MKEQLIKLLQFALSVQTKLMPANDKLGHFYWGFFYAFATSLFTDNLLVIIIPSVLALSKEIMDSTGLGNVEKMDVFFTVLPGILIYLSKFIN
jgi:hypothetical protein